MSPSHSDDSRATRAFSRLAFPAGLACALGFSVVLPGLGMPVEMVLMAVLLTCLGIVGVAERLIPYAPAPVGTRRQDLKVDATSMAVMMGAVDPLLKAFWPVLIPVLWGLLGEPKGLGLFAASQPLALKLPVALLVAGFGEYCLHRLSHHWRPMWGFHALHHSANRIYSLNGFRSHPINVAWHQLAGYGVLLFLGVDQPTLVAFSALSICVATFQHANARLRLGVLNHVFSTNELHRWHHDSRVGQSCVNYSSVLSVWDRVFGTFKLSETERPGTPGLEPESGRNVRADRYWAQVFGPLRHLNTYASAVQRKDR